MYMELFPGLELSMKMYHVAFLLIACHVIMVKGADRKLRIEGDLVLSPRLAKVILSPVKNNEQKRSSSDEDIQPWKYGVIPYKFSYRIEAPLKALILKAFHVYKKFTCIRFEEAKPQDKDYVEFIMDHGCYSSVGREGGRQVISLGEGCDTLGHVLHELMHTLGFFHEQSRIDRDLYVKILWWNIADGAFKNFATYNHGGLEPLDTKYDVHSILHYERKAFTKNGMDTIESLLNPKEKLGHTNLSAHDIKKINKVYKCLFRWGR